MIKPIWLGLCSLLAALTIDAGASADAISIKAKQVDFVKSYVSAMQTKDRVAALKLLHPTLRACVTNRTRPFFDYLVTQQMTGFPSGAYAKLTIGPVKPKSEPSLWNFVPAKSFPYPVRPTHDITIEFGNGSVTYFSDLLEVAPSGDSWYWVTACPNADGVRFFAMMQAKAAAQKAKAKKLAAKVHEPLLSEMKRLIAANDTFGAAQAYQKATGSDFSTAMSVVDALASP